MVVLRHLIHALLVGMLKLDLLMWMLLLRFELDMRVVRGSRFEFEDWRCPGRDVKSFRPIIYIHTVVGSTNPPKFEPGPPCPS